MSEKNKPRIYFYLDASIELGIGHLMRCECLAKELCIKGFECVLVSSSEHQLLSQYSQSFTKVITIEHYLELNSFLFQTNDKSLLIVDSYQINDDFCCKIKSHNAIPIVVIDDLERTFNDADLHVSFSNNITSTNTVFAGTQYTFIRDEFLTIKSNQLLFDAFINFGGTDPELFTLKVLAQLAEIKITLSLCIVVGKNFPQILELRQQIANCHHRIQLVIDADNMAELMAQSKLLIIAPGTSVFEGAVVARPMALLLTDPCQKNNYSLFVEQHAAIAADLSTIKNTVLNPPTKTEQASLIKNAQNLCDGQGKFKIVEKIIKLVDL